jgi:formamidopyrimidine-DNA glycosylase
MPEGPEISYMRYIFHNAFKNKILNKIIVQSGRYTRHPLPENFDVLMNNLPLKIESIKNKGKFIYVTFENEMILGIKLNYGHLVFEDGKQCHIKFETNKGDFYIEDLRNFCTLNVLNNDDLNKILNRIGPDLIHDKIEFEFYNEILNKRPKMKIGEFLIEQKYFSGAGNYIRCEACYESKISPFRLVGNLTESERKELFKQLIKICHSAYESLIEKDVHYKCKVYRQKMTPKGEIVISEKLEKTRNVYWVPSIQK